MIPALRQRFNANFTPEKYQRFLKVMEERCGTPVKFRVCETPCFFPKELLDQMSQYGKELIRQMDGLEYRKASFQSIPPDFNVPNEAPHPLFVQVDFGLVRDGGGKLQPKLVELQGFPSLYAYQAMLSQVYIEVFGLDANLKYLLGGLDWENYQKLLRRAIVGDHNPSNVILMEIDPAQQKTLVRLAARTCHRRRRDPPRFLTRRHPHSGGRELTLGWLVRPAQDFGAADCGRSFRVAHLADGDADFRRRNPGTLSSPCWQCWRDNHGSALGDFPGYFPTHSCVALVRHRAGKFRPRVRDLSRRISH